MEKTKLAFIGKFIVVVLALVGLVQVLLFLSVKFHLTNTAGIIDMQSDEFWQEGNATSTFVLSDTREWAYFRNAVAKDAAVLNRVERETGVKARLIVSEMMAEQLRLYFSDRGWFERVLEPKKSLFSAVNGQSLGLLGIRVDTAKAIEAHLRDSSSLYYLGPDMEGLLDFAGGDIDNQRFIRLTDTADHYYTYLYAALYNKQIMKQWKDAGHDISDRPEILATLYNIGFKGSVPKANPRVGGGVVINTGGLSYSFGSLAHSFYYSGELLEDFPR